MVLDDERKAAMVSNLLVVLCSDSETHPIINAGTLYTSGQSMASPGKKSFVLRIDPDLWAEV